MTVSYAAHPVAEVGDPEPCGEIVTVLDADSIIPFAHLRDDEIHPAGASPKES